MMLIFFMPDQIKQPFIEKDPKAETKRVSHSLSKPIQTFLRNNTKEMNWNYPRHRKKANPEKGS